MYGVEQMDTSHLFLVCYVVLYVLLIRKVTLILVYLNSVSLCSFICHDLPL